MPQMGDTITEGEVTTWLVVEGAFVERDQPLFEISTDKVDAEIPSPVSGTLTKIVAPVGAKVPVNDVVAIIALGQKEESKGELPHARLTYSDTHTKNNTIADSPRTRPRVFLVHGHDHLLKETVARFLERLGLDVIILHEQPNRGETIIEKLSRHAAVDFAVILLTPDDLGGPKSEPNTQNPRARQNVVFELGYFIGAIGRHRVCALYEGAVELPSDMNGIVYIQRDHGGAWRVQLARELKHANFELNLQTLLSST